MNGRGEIRWWEIAVTLTLTIMAAICVVLLLLPGEPAWRKWDAGFLLLLCAVGVMMVLNDQGTNNTRRSV